MRLTAKFKLRVVIAALAMFALRALIPVGVMLSANHPFELVMCHGVVQTSSTPAAPAGDPVHGRTQDAHCLFSAASILGTNCDYGLAMSARATSQWASPYLESSNGNPQLVVLPQPRGPPSRS